MDKKIYLPDEIFIKILLFVPDLYKLRQLNKNYDYEINNIYNRFNNLFIQITQTDEWIKRIKFLIKILIQNKNLEAIVFLLNNYQKQSQEFASFYAGYYKYTELLNLSLLNNYLKLGEGAAEGGHLDIVKFAISRGIKNLNWLLYAAAKGGRLNVVKYFIENNTYGITVNSINYAAAYAAEFNHNEVLEYLLKKGANNLTLMSTYAALGGNITFIKYALNNGVKNFSAIILKAAEGGHLHIVELIYPRIPYMLRQIANAAAKGGKLNIIIWAFEKGINTIEDINEIAEIAAKYDHLNVIIWAFQHGANIVNDIALVAALNGYYDIVKWAIDNHSNVINNIAFLAAGSGHLDIVKLAIKNGANNFTKIRNWASASGHNHIVSWLEKYT